MKFLQFVLGFLLLYLSILGVYAALTTEPKNWVVVGIGIAFTWLSIIYISADLINYEKYKKKDYIDVSDAEGRNTIRGIIAFVALGFGIFILYKYFSIPILIGFFLLVLLAAVYTAKTPTSGLYKNGKYLGIIYKGFIKVADGVYLGKKENIEYTGKLKIFKDGNELARLVLTAEGLMELRPDKLKDVFPEITRKIEKFEGKPLFKIGDYTVEYDFSKGYASYYEEEFNKIGEVDTSRDETFTSPLYGGFYSGNIWN
jgi:hypothetical protein